jgi:hypothetical protein
VQGRDQAGAAHGNDVGRKEIPAEVGHGAVIGDAEIVHEAPLAPSAVPAGVGKDESGGRPPMGMLERSQIDGSAAEHGEKAGAERIVAAHAVELDLDVFSSEHLRRVDQSHYGGAADVLGGGKAARQTGQGIGKGSRTAPLAFVPSGDETLGVVGEDEAARFQAAVAV